MTTTTSHDVWSTPLTPLAFLGRAAEVFPDREAVVYGERRMTYKQFSGEVTRVAHALLACGINPGERVAYLLPNIPEMLVAHVAVPLAVGVLLANNTRFARPCDHSRLQHAGSPRLGGAAQATARSTRPWSWGVRPRHERGDRVCCRTAQQSKESRPGTDRLLWLISQPRRCWSGAL